MALTLLDEYIPLKKAPNGFTILVTEDMLTTSFRRCYHDFGSWDEADAVAMQIVSDIITQGARSLKVEFMELEKDEDNLEPYVQIKIRSTATRNKNPFKRLLDRFPEVKVQVSLEYIPLEPELEDEDVTYLDCLEGVQIDRANYVLTAKGRPRNNPFSSWEPMGLVKIELKAVIGEAAVYPDAYLSRPDVPAQGTREMLEEGVNRDMVISAKNGVEIRCHTAIIKGCSAVLQGMIETGTKESQICRLNFWYMSEEGLKAFLRYIYYRDLEGPKADIGIAFEVLYAAHKYDVPRLRMEMIKYLLERDDSDFTVKMAFSIYLFVRNIMQAFLLRMKMARIFKSKWGEVEALTEYIELCSNRPQNANELCEDLARAFLTEKLD